ncbi:MAG: heme o synthase [Acidobacteriota bacterium]
MSRGAGVAAVPGSLLRGAGGSLRDYLELTKPRVSALVVATTASGFYLASPARPDPVLFLHALIGVALAAAGTSALNQYVEREVDGRMIRTRGRPLPAGRLRPGRALAFALAISGAGLLHLASMVNLLTALLVGLTLLSYIFVYTPLKRRTSLSTLVGAIPGALPPLAGWTAATGEIAAGGLALFGILFVWQLPHSLAIAWMYREDYARGGFALLPVIDPDGGSTGRQILAQSLVLLPLSLVPAVLGMAGGAYFCGAVVLGVTLLAIALPTALRGSAVSARRLLMASVIYLPLLLGLMALDRTAPPLR